LDSRIEQQEARIKLNEIVNDLTTEGVDYFFHYSLKIIGMNIIAKKAKLPTRQCVKPLFVLNIIKEQFFLNTCR